MTHRIFKRTLSLLLMLLMCITSVTYTGVLSANAVSYTMYLRGTFNDWEAPSDYLMTNDNNNHCSITVTLDAGTYSYKAATQDWTSCVIPSGDNATVTLSEKSEVTFVADFSSLTVQAFVKSSLPQEETDGVILRSQWAEHNDLILALKDNAVTYVSADSKSSSDNYSWNIIPCGDESFYLQNDGTKGYAYYDKGNVLCSANGNSTTAGKWKIDTSTGNKRFVNAQSGTAINIENLSGNAQCSDVPIYYTSAQWSFEYSSYNYTMHTNGITDTGYSVTANSPTSITSYASGSAKTWTLSKDISAQPTFSAPNTPLASAVYNLTMEETLKSIHTDSYGEVFYTGTEWQKVWTRDTAMSCMYSLSWLFPEISYNCQREKIKTSDNISVFEEDTGSGGSYPVSTDKIITMLSVWETYLSDGNKDHLKYFYDICENTILQDLNVAYDKESGLFRGETSGTDWRDQTYPDWTSETVNNGLNNIAESKSASVNVYYVKVLEIMSKAAKILGKSDNIQTSWAKMSEQLEEKVSKRLWNSNLGLYSAWEYPEYMGSVLAEKADVIGNGYALWFNVGTDEQLSQIAENYPLVSYGAPTVYPQKMGTLTNATKYYHNRGIWPGWQTALMIGANYNGNEAVAEEIFNSNVRGVATALTNKEVINYETGEGICSDQQLWSIAGTLAGYYRVLFGMNYDEDGITFDPAIPDWMEGPFTLENYTYRNATLNITLKGSGDKMTDLKVDGVSVASDYVFPASSTGTHTIEITMENSGETDKMNKSDDNLVICPSMPTLSYQNGTLYWTPTSGLTYKLWNGEEYIDVTGQKSYKVDTSVYGSYSLMSVSAEGVCSELSKPVVVSPTRIKVEAESGSVSSQSVIKTTVQGYSGTGYVQDKKSYSANLEITVEIPQDGTYLMSAIYNNTGDATSGTSCAIRSVYVDGNDEGSLCFPEVNSGHNYQLSTHLNLTLTKGTHKVKIFYDTSNFYDRNMKITKNDVELDYFNFDLVSTSDEPTTETTAPTEATTAQVITTAPTEATTAQVTTTATTEVTTAQVITTATTEATTVQPTTETTEETKPTVLKGDANKDGKIDINDVSYIQKFLASFSGYDCELAVCDVDNNGRISIKDGTEIQKHLLGLASTL
jgi:hypothetical protein